MKRLTVILVTILLQGHLLAQTKMTLEEAKTNGMLETLRDRIVENENIVDICIYEQEWFRPEGTRTKGRLVLRAAVTHVHAGRVPLGTRLEFDCFLEDSPRVFKNFRGTVDGELRTFFFSDDSVVQREKARWILNGDSHWGFARVDDSLGVENLFAELFRRELSTNPKLKSANSTKP
jgi:hypothetical protein